MTWCAAWLGDLPLDEANFDWPVQYSGVEAPRVEVRQGALRFAALKALATGQTAEGYVLKMRVRTAAATASERFKEIEIPGVYIDKVEDGPGKFCTLYLSDRRLLLRDYDFPFNINLQFYQGYVNDTAESQFEPMRAITALTKLSAFAPFADHMSAGWEAAVGNVVIPNAMPLGGMAMEDGLSQLLEVIGYGLAMDGGKFYFHRREDYRDTTADSFWRTVAWSQLPGWLPGKFAARDDADRPTGQNRVRGAMAHVDMAAVEAWYRERHTLRVSNLTPSEHTTSAERASPDAPELYLDPVYPFAGAWLSLRELLTVNRFGATDITEADIARVFHRRTFQGTKLDVTKYSGEEQERAYRVYKCIKDNWRRFYGIQSVDEKERWGAWTDPDLGEQSAAGDYRAGTVDGDWVELLREPKSFDVQVAGGQWQKPPKVYALYQEHRTVLDTAGLKILKQGWRVDNAGKLRREVDYLGQVLRDTAVPSPFNVRWADQHKGVIAIEPNRELLAGSDARLGRLRVGPVSQAFSYSTEFEVAKVNQWLQDFTQDRVSTVAMTEYLPAYEFAVYITAVRQKPNDGGRFTKIIVYSDRTQGYNPGRTNVHPVIPVPDQPEARIVRKADGTLVVANELELMDDAILRGVEYLREQRLPLVGPGVTPDVHLVYNRRLAAHHASTVIEVRGNVIQARVEFGNLSSEKARRAKRELAVRAREITLGGKKVR